MVLFWGWLFTASETRRFPDSALWGLRKTSCKCYLARARIKWINLACNKGHWEPLDTLDLLPTDVSHGGCISYNVSKKSGLNITGHQKYIQGTVYLQNKKNKHVPANLKFENFSSSSSFPKEPTKTGWTWNFFAAKRVAHLATLYCLATSDQNHAILVWCQWYHDLHRKNIL